MSTLFSLDEAVLAHYFQRLAGLAWLPGELLDIVSGTVRAQLASQSRPYQPGPDQWRLAASTQAGPEAHAQGQPLLPAAAFPIDLARARGLWEELCALLTESGGKPAAAVRDLRREVEKHASVPEEAFAAFARGDGDFFERWGQRLPQAPALVHFLAQAALTPQLAATAELLASGHDSRRVWEYGHCPVCGRPPFMGALRGKEGQRWHSCSFCGVSWRAPRLQCPFCLERGEDKLRMFTTDCLPRYEVQVCKGCGNYIKLDDLREKDGGLPPCLSDLASLPLDVLARQEGYARPTPSAWGF